MQTETLEILIAAARATLDTKYQAREAALAHGRALTRTCANAIRAMHRGEWEIAHNAVETAQEEAQRVGQKLSAHPDLLFAGYVQDAHKELAEAAVLYALMNPADSDTEFPTPATLGIETASYLNGLAEAASEGRRYALDCLRRGEIDRSQRMLTTMDEILSALTTLDYPDALTGGLRRTCDALRAVVERTRGDVTIAVLQENLMHTLQR